MTIACVVLLSGLLGGIIAALILGLPLKPAWHSPVALAGIPFPAF